MLLSGGPTPARDRMGPDEVDRAPVKQGIEGPARVFRVDRATTHADPTYVVDDVVHSDVLATTIVLLNIA